MATEHKTATRRDVGLVVVALFGPAAWSAFLVVSYILEDPIACAPAAGVRGQILGIGVKGIATVVSGVLGGATVLVGVLSFVWWTRLRHENSTGRAGWMALAGVLNSVLFGIVIIVGLAPSFFLRACTPSP